MKQLLITIAALVPVGCGESQQSAPAPEVKLVDPVAEVPTKPPSPVESQTAETVAEASQPEPPTAKAPDISIHQAAEDGHIESVKQHLAAGTDVDVKNKYGVTPLHRAALVGNKETVELLIAKGADVNAKFASGATSLDAVTEHIDNDAYAKPKDDLGLPTVSIDIPNYIKYAAEIANLLRKHGAKTAEELKAEGK